LQLDAQRRVISRHDIHCNSLQQMIIMIIKWLLYVSFIGFFHTILTVVQVFRKFFIALHDPVLNVILMLASRWKNKWRRINVVSTWEWLHVVQWKWKQNMWLHYVLHCSDRILISKQFPMFFVHEICFTK
jgi:hypothetical protein